MKLTFLGATNTVTGSRYLVGTARARVLIDCGLFQGFKQLRLRNWEPPPIDPAMLDAVVLTHAHLDHTGYFPRLVQAGYRGAAYCTAATQALLALLLPDSGHLQEEEAHYAQRRGYSKHKQPRTLYTEADARDCLKRLQPVPWHHAVSVAPGVEVTWLPAGHILGAASVIVRADGATVAFSGDVGRADDALMPAPTMLPPSDLLVMESTYGDREHPKADPEAALGDCIRTVAARGGVLLIPAFAVGRAQLLTLLVARLRARGAIPDLPLYLNSPMASDVSGLYHRFRTEHRLSEAECDAMCGGIRFVNSVEESRALNTRRDPMIIISASGMVTGGRILHHLRAFAPDPRTMILLAGYQVGGTRGAALAAGTRTLRMFGTDVPVNAEVRELPAISGHADANGLIAWLRSGGRATQVCLTHGEPAAADALRGRIEREIGWPVRVPDYRDTIEPEAVVGASA